MSDILKSTQIIQDRLLFGKPLNERLQDLHTEIKEEPLLTEADRQRYLNNRSRFADQTDAELRHDAIHGL